MIKAVLFDFDGVIGDSSKVTLGYMMKTIRHFHLPAPSIEAFEPYKGMKTIDIYRKLFPTLSEKKIDKIFLYSSEQSLKHAHKVPLFAGVIEILNKLGKSYKLALITSRGKKSLEIIFKKYQLHEHFLFVVDREDLQNHKPHPEGILRTLDFFNISKDEAIFIGDSEPDVLAAHSAGIPCILVGREHLHNADYHIMSLTDLPALLKQL